jgi:hypothetical protein
VSRVEINADGRSVVVDHVGDLPYLIEQAMGAWQATDKPKATSGFVLTRDHLHTDERCTDLLCVCTPAYVGVPGRPDKPKP